MVKNTFKDDILLCKESLACKLSIYSAVIEILEHYEDAYYSAKYPFLENANFYINFGSEITELKFSFDDKELAVLLFTMGKNGEVSYGLNEKIDFFETPGDMLSYILDRIERFYITHARPDDVGKAVEFSKTERVLDKWCDALNFKVEGSLSQRVNKAINHVFNRRNS